MNKTSSKEESGKTAPNRVMTSPNRVLDGAPVGLRSSSTHSITIEEVLGNKGDTARKEHEKR